MAIQLIDNQGFRSKNEALLNDNSFASSHLCVLASKPAPTQPPSTGRSKVAFTLAEVLITLGIIGVVAAMTMPTLIAKYQEQVLINQAKKALSIVNNAYMQTLNDYGISAFDQSKYTNTEKTEFTKAFLGKLNVVEKHENEQLLANGIIPNYTPLSTAMANPDEKYLEEQRKKYAAEGEEFNLQEYAARNFDGYDDIARWSNAYYLNDGTCIIFYPYPGYISASAFLIDVNGKKGPNRWGYDLFLAGADSKKPSVGLNKLSEAGGIIWKVLGLE